MKKGTVHEIAAVYFKRHFIHVYMYLYSSRSNTFEFCYYVVLVIVYYSIHTEVVYTNRIDCIHSHKQIELFLSCRRVETECVFMSSSNQYVSYRAFNRIHCNTGVDVCYCYRRTIFYSLYSFTPVFFLVIKHKEFISEFFECKIVINKVDSKYHLNLKYAKQ